jgi:CDGSH-type Zn-finger protein
MEKAEVAGKSPHILEMESGKTYAWCACGKSSNQPWCDGSHQGSSFSPTVFTVDKAQTAAMCMCKQTKNPPYCDGSHMNLEEK